MAEVDVEEVEQSTLAAYALQLQSCLQWNPLNGVESQDKQLFVEALTEIAALPLDSINMEIRRLLVVSGANEAPTTQESSRQEQSPTVYLPNLIAALSARDVQLKCKAANAVGSLCISRVAGQQLLDLHGDEIFKSVAKMATCKNQWAQGDAFFVLGWIVVIGDEDQVAAIATLLPTVVKCLHRNLNLSLLAENHEEGEEDQARETAVRSSKAALMSSEQASNFRVYALVLLLNFSQRHVDILAGQLDTVLSMLRDLVVKLLDPVPRPVSEEGESTATTIPNLTFFDASEYAEVLRLAVTFLSVLVDQLDNAASQLLDLKMLPSLLKLKRQLDTAEILNLVGESGIQDIAEILQALIEMLLNCR